MKQKSRLWIWIIKQIPINYIFGIVEDAHKWQKQSLGASSSNKEQKG